MSFIISVPLTPNLPLLPLPPPLLIIGRLLAFTVSALHVTFFTFFFFLSSKIRVIIKFCFSICFSSFFFDTSSAFLIFSWFSGEVMRWDVNTFFLRFTDLSLLGIGNNSLNRLSCQAVYVVYQAHHLI